MSSCCNLIRGSRYTTLLEFGPQNHRTDGPMGPNSMMVVYMDPFVSGTSRGLTTNLMVPTGALAMRGLDPPQNPTSH